MTDEEAVIEMVDANIQREKVMPSEKAWAYRMKLEAIKHQGARTDLTSVQVEQKLSARDKVAKDAGEKSGIQIMRYIRLGTFFLVLAFHTAEGEKVRGCMT